MSIELTPLQQHCLKGIGISPWALRSSPQQVVLKTELVAEPTMEYQINNQSEPESAHLVHQLESALAYVKQQQTLSDEIDWSTSKSTTDVSFKNNQLTLPLLADVFSSHSLKKQLWKLLSSHNQ